MDTDTLNYFPIKDGLIPPSSVKMDKHSKLPPEQQKLFQIDNHFWTYRANKEECRQEDLHKYYRSTNSFDTGPVVKYMVERLCKDYPQYFIWDDKHKILHCELTNEMLFFDDDYQITTDNYYDAIDAIAMQVPEDIAICVLPKNAEADHISNIHLMAANGWSADWAVGNSFALIHNDVRNSKNGHVVKFPIRMVRGIINNMGEPVQRVGAISFRPEFLLNRHPDDVESNIKPWNFDNDQLVYLRFERQTVVPFPECDAFLFTIRTYFNDLKNKERRETALKALRHAHEDAYAREFLAAHKDNLIKFLENL